MFLCSQPDGSGPVPAVVELEAAGIAAAPPVEGAETPAAGLEEAKAPPLTLPGASLDPAALAAGAASSTPNISSAKARFECLTLSAAVLLAAAAELAFELAEGLVQVVDLEL